jgi:hypothetical protein
MEEEQWQEGPKNRWRYKAGTEGQQIEIELDKGKVATIDANRLHEVQPYKWMAYKGGKMWYARTTVDKKSRKIYMHALLFPAIDPPRDHIDRNGLHNLAVNIRPGAGGVNQRNQGEGKGVSIDAKSGAFRARWIDFEGTHKCRSFHQKDYRTPELAYAAAVAFHRTKNDEVILQLQSAGLQKAPIRTVSNNPSGRPNLTTGIRGLLISPARPKLVKGQTWLNGKRLTACFAFSGYGGRDGAIAAGEAWLAEVRSQRIPRGSKKRQRDETDVPNTNDPE